MTPNGNYLQGSESTNVYTGLFPRHAGSVVRSALRKLGIMNKDCKVIVYENGEVGTVEVKVKQPYSKSEVFKIAKQAILEKIHPESKRPTKLQSEVKSPLFLYTDYS